jgi:zinc protease
MIKKVDMKFIKIVFLCLFGSIANLYSQIVPTYETYSLKNGMKVYFLQYGTIPAINMKLVLNTGKVNEAPGQQNYSELIANTLLMGNTKYNLSDQTDLLFKLGTNLSAEATNDNTVIQLNVLSENSEEGLDIFSSAILNPIFDKEKIDLYKSQIIDFNSFTKMDISDLVNVFSDYFIYGISNPLGRYFYKKQLDATTLDIIKEYYQFNFTPKNSSLIITGKFDAALMKGLIEKYFGTWKSPGGTNSVALDNPIIKKKEIAFINRNNASQCALMWSKIAPNINDKDATAFEIVNDVFNTVLFKEIREKGGKTYNIGSIYSPSKYSNLFQISCSVRSEELINSIELFDRTLDNFYKIGVDEETFKKALTKRITNINRIESPEAISNFYNPVIYNFDKRKNRINELNSLTLEQINKVLKKYYTPGIYKLVISGDETKIKNQLSKINNLTIFTSTDLERNN